MSGNSPIWKKLLRLLLFFGLGIGVFSLVYKNQNAAFQKQCALDGVSPEQCSLIDKLWGDFSTVHLGWMLLVVAAFTLSNIFRALRWQMLMEPMGYTTRFSSAFWSIILGYFANLGFPRMGEVIRVGAFAKREQLPVEKVMGTLVLDRLMDMFCLLAIIGLAFLLEYETLYNFINNGRSASGASGTSTLLQFLLGGMLVGGLLLFVFRKKIMESVLFLKVKKMLLGFMEGLGSIFKLRNIPLFLAYTIGIWLMFYLQCLFNLWAFPPTAHLTAGPAVMIFVIGTLGMVVPSPGGMGTFHAMAIAGLALYGISGSDGFSYANIAFFAIQILYNLVGGLLAMFFLRK